MEDWIPPLFVALIGAVAALGGVLAGGWISTRQEAERRRHAFLTRQLEEFYGPLVGLRADIKAASETRQKVQNAADRAWQRLSETGGNTISTKERLSGRLPEFIAIMEDDDANFRAAIFPSYERMLAVFRETLWLAEPETRAFLPALAEYVDIWRRTLNNSIPGDVVRELDHSEANLYAMYDHIEEVHDRLRADLANEPNRRSHGVMDRLDNWLLGPSD